MKPILLLAETGIIVRNLLLGTFANEVMKQRPLVVAVRNPDDPKLLEVIAGMPMRLVPYHWYIPPTAKTRLDKLKNWQTFVYRFKSVEKDTQSSKMQMRFDGAEAQSLIGRAGTGLISMLGRGLARSGQMWRFDELFLLAQRRRPMTRKWKQLIAEIDPAAVLSTTLTLTTKVSPSQDLPAVLAAIDLGIPTGTLIQSWDNLSSKAAVLPRSLDRLWTWSDPMTAELRTLYPQLAPDRITVVGGPQFDFHRPEIAESRAAFCARFGFDPARPVVLIGTGTAVRIPYEAHQALELAKALRAVRPDLHVLIRTHPKDDGARWRALATELAAVGAVVQHTAPDTHMDQGGFVPAREFYREQVSALLHSAVVVNSASTLTVDAALLDRPVISLVYDTGDPDPKFPEGRAITFTQSTHFSPLVATGGVKLAYSQAECVELVVRYLAHPEYERAERKEIVKIVAGPADGGAGQRLAREVLELAAGGPA